jgi:hypothetical protein
MLSEHERAVGPSGTRDPSELTHVCAGYVTTGGWHAVYVAVDHVGRWQIFDASATGLVLVETLTGHDDRLDQAEAEARDYAREKAGYHAGVRTRDPLPRPHMVLASRTT